MGRRQFWPEIVETASTVRTQRNSADPLPIDDATGLQSTNSSSRQLMLSQLWERNDDNNRPGGWISGQLLGGCEDGSEGFKLVCWFACQADRKVAENGRQMAVV
ncbi:Hypothetical predicted protein [Olea europaea subsp. europaea]|uniref:Uncharacterized protein n=1 Tax=Olea europaea subsp. europaea TaxID=158383 RepID=A0A8S0TIL2_OLEEU|nr:Hypothetical predicted protein [Olea europaea subsp. europaea]